MKVCQKKEREKLLDTLDDCFVEKNVKVYQKNRNIFGWDGMGWDKLADTGVATAQKFVQRPTPCQY